MFNIIFKNIMIYSRNLGLEKEKRSRIDSKKKKKYKKKC